VFRDHLVPGASREHADRLTGCDLDILAGERLIHLDSDNKSWTTWQDWFLRQGYDGPIASGIRLNNYSVALQVAQDGGGIALGWQRLIRPIILTQHLFPISPHVIAAPHRFYLVGRPDSELTKAAMQLKQWIIKEESTISGEVR
jgi:DNA-binding transcriptional LysR family regulator